MKIRLWGTRGSVAAAGPETVRYGGDTSSVQVTSSQGDVIVLDAGSGIRQLGAELAGSTRIDILLTHLHMDHIQGLGFFAPLFDPDTETHIWGPASTTMGLSDHLGRYMSPPLFPVRLRDLPNHVTHDLAPSSFRIGNISIDADLVCHPGMTLGYRLTDDTGTLAYIPDHEPALGARTFPDSPEWTSGFALMQNADILIHDAQYTQAEYDDRVGWGHTSFQQLMALAEMAGVGTLVTFHHDPSHTDDFLDDVESRLRQRPRSFELIPGIAGREIALG